MAPYKYKFENFLNLKQKIEDQKKAVMAQKFKKYNDEVAKKKALEDEYISTLEESRGNMSTNLHVNDLVAYNHYLSKLKNDIIKQQNNIDLARQELESSRKELEKSLMERKVFENLKEKDFEAYKIEENLSEQKITDEIVSYKYWK